MCVKAGEARDLILSPGYVGGELKVFIWLSVRKVPYWLRSKQTVR